MTDNHALIIDSLRDLQAHCSCGRWTLTTCSFDRETNEEIEHRAWQNHLSHRNNARRAERHQEAATDGN